MIQMHTPLSSAQPGAPGLSPFHYTLLKNLMNEPVKAAPAINWETGENLIPVHSLKDAFTLLSGTPRTGFIEHQIENPENVGGHTWDLVRLASHLAPVASLDPQKCRRLAAVHDLAEALAIDVTPPMKEYISAADKLMAETMAMDALLSWFPPKEAHTVYALWKEYEDQLTPEAQFVSILDKAIQVPVGAIRHEKAGDCRYALHDFYNSASKRRESVPEPLQDAFDFIVAQRPLEAFKKPELLRTANPAQDGTWAKDTVRYRIGCVESLRTRRISAQMPAQMAI